MTPVVFDADKHCGGRTTSGAPCRRPKGWDTPHPGIGRCKLHGGSTRNHIKHAEKERRKGEIGKLIEEISRDSDSDQVGTISEAVTVARRMMRATDVLVRELDDLVAKTGEDGWEQHDLVAQLQQWTTNAAKIAKLGLDAGIDERRQSLQEEQAELMAQGFRTLIDGFTAALARAGLERKIIEATWRESGPELVREALAVEK